jgi:hypothetical protein
MYKLTSAESDCAVVDQTWKASIIIGVSWGFSYYIMRKLTVVFYSKFCKFFLVWENYVGLHPVKRQKKKFESRVFPQSVYE